MLGKPSFRFVDAYLFMAPHTNLDKFVKAYLHVEDHSLLKFNHKLEFPYEFIDNIEKLDQTEMPAAEYFTNTSRKTYLECNDVVIKKQLLDEASIKRTQAVRDFAQNNCKTLKDYLKIYNNADVSPFIMAVKNLCNLYQQTTNVDLFDFITLPSLAKHVALKLSSPKGCFTRFSKDDEDMSHAVRGAIVGGASIVWTRFAEAGVTKIRPYEFGDAAETVKSIIGLDMSGCYLYAASQEHLTGPYFVRLFDHKFTVENYKALKNVSSVMAIEYWAWLNFGNAGLLKVQHKFAGGEKQIRMQDGYVFTLLCYTKLWRFETLFFTLQPCVFCGRILGN